MVTCPSRDKRVVWTLDALCTTSDDALVAYLAAVRSCLLTRSLESAVPPLLVHFTDDPPGIRGELFDAAFRHQPG